MDTASRTLDRPWNTSREDNNHEEPIVQEHHDFYDSLVLEPSNGLQPSEGLQLSTNFLPIINGNPSITPSERDGLCFHEDQATVIPLISDPEDPSFNHLYRFSGFQRPIGYEDRHPNPGRSQRRRRSTSATTSSRHPRQYTTDWTLFNPAPETTTLGGDYFNIRASNVDRHLSDNEIEDFFRGRCGSVDAFRLEKEPRSKVVYLSLNVESAKHNALALHGFMLGRRRLKMEWYSKE